MITLYGLKTCDTCRKALKALEAGAPGPVTFRDIRAERLTAAERARFLGAFGEKLVNTRSTTWRGLDEAERAGDPDALLEAHPALMKRPVIDGPGGLTLGWDKAAQAAHLST
ncbi:arsenate reductase family protein [Kangsaoukella pontilimi]|uniref:arsenate reductase family protein n=1 Tax=Kangsaoukella pontilimi TaxID=2691042 RepID=UPI001D0AE5B7